MEKKRGPLLVIVYAGDYLQFSADMYVSQRTSYLPVAYSNIKTKTTVYMQAPSA